MKLLVAAAFVIGSMASCGRGATTERTRAVVAWRQVGSWSGHGNVQTESFTSDTGGFRVRWETKHETKPGQGRLKVVFRSGDSGRDIIDAVDARGVGSGMAEVGDRPRWYFLTIESDYVDWSVTVEEPITGVYAQ